ncbi:STAS domain-containing protein [Streptosporangium sp. NPDC048865]|uniref:STAS domain-containing protein n=1 Tax=Streptosporangium sp. NPDC048865 TaxID=3155766 RepID=UPI003413A3FA
MKLSVQLNIVHQDTAVVAVAGELDLTTIALLDAVLLPLPGQGVRHLIIAADRLRFCDPCGLRALTSVHTIMAATGGTLVIAEPGPVLRRLLAPVRPQATDPSATPIRTYPTLAQALRGEIGLRPSSPVGTGLSL